MPSTVSGSPFSVWVVEMMDAMQRLRPTYILYIHEYKYLHISIHLSHREKIFSQRSNDCVYTHRLASYQDSHNTANENLSLFINLSTAHRNVLWSMYQLLWVRVSPLAR